MTEFETATLAFQQATLAFQESGLAFQEAGLWIATAHVAATHVIGAGQIGIVWYGIRAMNRASEQRSNDARAEARCLAAADERRHAEAMRALEALIARTAPAG